MKTDSIMKKLIRLWSIFSLLLACMTVLAQQNPQRYTGTITNATGEPVVNATVKVKGTSAHAITDITGKFSIDASPGSSLLITSVGYVAREVKLTTASRVDVRLEDEVRNLDEVVVVGYGKMKKTDMSSAQIGVTSKEIQRTVNATLEQALQGRAAGVYVTTNSGQPGAAPSVMIRGLNSLNYSTQPLYVVDGVQMGVGNPVGGSGTSSNLLATINPDDIETINILQGPSATAIYGATGANGVVMITTKRGKSGETKITFNSLVTVQDTPDPVPVMNLQEYAAYRNELAAQNTIPYDPAFSDPKALGPGTNWQEEMLRRTMLQKYSLGLSGGNEKSTFYLGIERFDQDGVLKGSGFTRHSIRLNLDNQTRKWLKIGTNLSIGQTKEVVNISNGDLLNIAIGQSPAIAVTNPDGSWGGPTSTQYQYSNPVALSQINDNRNKSIAFTGSVYATLNIYKGISFHNEFNTYYQYSNSYRFNPSYKFNGYVNSTTNSYRSSGNNYWWGLQQRLQYDKQFGGKHNVTAMLGHEASEWGSEGLFGSRQRYVSNNIQELSGGDATSATNGSNKNSSARESYFTRINYIYNDRYILNLTGRADGSANFGVEKRWGYFPAVSAAWRVSRESFMTGISFINDLKLRAEWGINGNSAAAGYYARLQAVPTPWGTGFISANYENQFLQWEEDKATNLGFDLYMLNNRIEIVADFYVKNIDKLLTRNAYPYYSGGDIDYSAGYIQFPTENVGSMRNHGFGVTVNTVNIQKKLTWKTGLNFSVDRNKITSLRNNSPINTLYGNSSLMTSVQVGQPAALFTGYIAEGLFQNVPEIQNHATQSSFGADPNQGVWVGDVKFKDINKDGIIDQNDRTVIGNPWPKFSFGFNNAVNWKNFDLNIFFAGVYGNDVFNYTRFRNENPSGTNPYSNYFKAVSNFARPSSVTPGDMTAVLTNPGHRISRIVGYDAGNFKASQWQIEDGSYIRLKNISLSYTVPSKWAGKVFMRNLKVGVNVQNLFTITKYKGYDPEIGMSPNTGSLSVGIDDARYPSTRFYTFNLTADF